MRLLTLISFLMAVLSVSMAQNTKRTPIGNQNMSVILPEGFAPTKGSNVYINPKIASSIFVYDIKEMGYLEYLEQLTPEYFKSQDLNVLKKYTVNEPDFAGEIIECQITLDTILFNRIFYVTGNETETALYMANYPANIENELKANLLNSMKSIRNE